MVATKLSTIRVEKPWGRHRLGAGFPNVPANQPPVGEIWFEPPTPDDELLVKYLFTSERLSIQVHPNDRQAKSSGFRRGKEEAWLILEAEDDARIGLGTKAPLTDAEFRASLSSGDVVEKMDWKPVQVGDVIYVPAGTVHAIGAGITLIEVQQNVDLTYRLYDYGRPRELHLDAGVAVSKSQPFEIAKLSKALSVDRYALIQDRKFVIEEWSWSGAKQVQLPPRVTALFVTVSGAGVIGGESWQGGECWQLSGETMIEADQGSRMLLAYPGKAALPLFCAR